MALSVTASPSPAGAAETIGQLVPAPATCADNNDWAQQSVASGNSYVVPATGGITSWTVSSWSTNTGAGAGQTITMKIFRKFADPTFYTVVGHDGPRALTPGVVNTFPASVQVKPGDVLGLHSEGSATCLSPTTPGDSVLDRGGNAVDGEIANFTFSTTRHLNIAAVLRPVNAFALGGFQRNNKKGTATLTVDVPNPGELTGLGQGVSVAAGAPAVLSNAVSAGPAQLLIKATGKKKRKLKKTGKAKLNIAITYTPTGGDPSTQSATVKLRKRRR